MIILDTNLISELISETPNERVSEWAATVPAQSLYLSSITIAEMRYGIEIIPEGKRRTALEESINAIIEREYINRILPFDHFSGDIYGVLAGKLCKHGVNIDQNDIMIAAIALRYDAPVATRNIKHFTPCGVTVINPFI